MNQLTNLVQWKNLTQEQKDEFDFENYKYEYQICREWIKYEMGVIDPKLDMVYRLVIEDDKWYTYGAYDCGHLYEHTVLGRDLAAKAKSPTVLLRPARPDEVPVEEEVVDRGLKLPQLEGYEYTGEFRPVFMGEYYLYSSRRSREAREAKCDIDLAHHILREIPTPEKTLEKRIQEKWPDKEVVMFDWCNHNIFFGFDAGELRCQHIEAQSFKGFDGYVYGGDTVDFYISTQPSHKIETVVKLPICFLRDRK